MPNNAKSVFLQVYASLRWLNNVSGVYSTQVWPEGFGRFLQVFALSSIWQADFANFMPTPGKTTNTAPAILSVIKAAMNKYTPLVISRNDKNELSIIKPTQTGSNRNKLTFCIIKSTEPLKNRKTSRVPWLGSSVHFCQTF